jgi:hypothetical protein
MKLGAITPVFKKKNDNANPFNYRGITVIGVVGKVFEKIIKLRIKPTLDASQNTQQIGFTTGTSPLNAALLLHEQIGEAIHTKSPLYIAFLDAKTAFDVVSLESLMIKLYLDGITGDMWQIVNDTFRP